MENSDLERDRVISVECGTCVATGTTACADCIVNHLFANDDGPIDYVTVAVPEPLSPSDRAVALFQRAGLVDDPVEFVPFADFEHDITVAAER